MTSRGRHPRGRRGDGSQAVVVPLVQEGLVVLDGRGLGGARQGLLGPDDLSAGQAARPSAVGELGDEEQSASAFVADLRPSQMRRGAAADEDGVVVDQVGRSAVSNTAIVVSTARPNLVLSKVSWKGSPENAGGKAPET